jgi:hypothetical protein
MDGTFLFMSTCPRCGHQRPQDVFPVPVLFRSLALGHLIEGYCLACDDIWPISSEERTLLVQALAEKDNNMPAPRAPRKRAVSQ